MKVFLSIAAISWSGLWLTLDQQGKSEFLSEDYASAAKRFEDPMWRGVALYRDGQFEKAAKAFALRDTAEANYNQGNSWLMNGKYDLAVTCYEQALTKRPGWKEAQENRDLAIARAKLIERTGGEMGDQTLGADKIVFDKKKKNQGQDTTITAEQATSDGQMQSLWLRRVQTKPADFLKSKFAYQYSESATGETK